MPVELATGSLVVSANGASPVFATLRGQTEVVHDIAHHRAPLGIDREDGTGGDRVGCIARVTERLELGELCVLWLLKQKVVGPLVS